MTRFEQEISGMLGEYWKKNAEYEMQKAVRKAENDCEVDENGGLKWKVNGCYVMDDFAEKLERAGYDFDRRWTAAARKVQAEKEIAEYKANYRGPSEEEIYEMQAAFGKGETIVDIITGQKITL